MLKEALKKYVTVLVIILLPTAGLPQSGKPNVVIMFIDNHGYYELSWNGNETVRTPSIDRLAEEGVNFTDFNAPPFCSPSRTALLTGRYALRSGVHNTVGGVSILNKNETTLADIMKSAGYKTAIFGKWHLGMSYPYTPDNRGFDEYFIHGGGGVSQLEDYFGNNHLDATYLHNGYYVKSRGYSTDVLFDQGIDFMNRNRENPFFCIISTPAVHFPTLLHPETGKRLKNRGIDDEKMLPLWSMIENVDDNVGRLIEYLAKSGLKENTLVILASDQGVNDRGTIHRGGEGTKRGVQYDEKHQVYCMIQYPKLTDTDQGDRNELAGMVDIFPTVLDICNIKQPANLDGISLKPLLGGKGAWDNERKLIIQCPRKRERNKWENVSVKYKKWRLVDGTELYNIEDDYGQKNNIITENPELVRILTSEYEKFWNSLPPADVLLPAHILGSPDAPSVRLNAMDWYLGDHPWGQGGLKNKNNQGTWRIEIVSDGNYRFELRRYPREEPRPVGAVRAAIDIAGHRDSVQLDIKDTKAILELDLQKGIYDMITFFEQPDDQEGDTIWGAYYVYVDYLGK